MKFFMLRLFIFSVLMCCHRKMMNYTLIYEYMVYIYKKVTVKIFVISLNFIFYAFLQSFLFIKDS